MSRQDSTKISDVKVLLKMGANGSGIASIEKTGSIFNVDTYTITFDDGTKTTFTVTNGTSIASIEKTGTEGRVDTYTITLTDGSTSTFEVTNGEGSSASSLPYDNTISELTATNVQDAIDEIDGIVDIQDAEIADMNNILGAKNLCPNTASTVSQSGMTFTVNSDGSINVSGTPTQTTGISLGRNILPKGTYKLTTLQGTVDELGYRTLLTARKASDDSLLGRSNKESGSSNIFTLSEDTEVKFSLWAETSGAINRRVYPMCKPASIKDETYVPYVPTNRELSSQISNLNKELWVNPNSGSAMGATTISLSDSIQNYRMLRVSFKIEYTQNYYVNALISVINGTTQAIKVTSLNPDGTLLFFRGVGISTGTSLNVESGRYIGALNSQPVAYTGALVPVRVWGIK